MVVTVITAVTFVALLIVLTKSDRRCPKGGKHDYSDWFPHDFADFRRVCSKCDHRLYK